MPEARWAVDLEVVDGFRIRNKGVVTVEAYDRITVTVKAKSGGTPSVATVDVQPGGEGKVKLLAISASDYTKPLTYVVDPDPEGPAVAGTPLDAPLYVVGAGAVSLLGTKLNALVLTNPGPKDVVVDIVVGRSATT